MPIVTCMIRPDGPLAEIRIGLSMADARAMEVGGGSAPKPLSGLGLIDTGSAFSFLGNDISSALNLVPTGYVAISTVTPGSMGHFMGQCDAAVTIVGHNSMLAFTSVRVVVCDLSALHVDMIIGRGVLDQCFLCYDGLSGRCTLAG